MTAFTTQSACVEPVPPMTRPTPPQIRTILTVIWLAILAGLTLQVAVLVLKGAAFAHVPDARAVAEAVQKVSWSVIVCVALAGGTAAGKGRELLTGLAGLLAAPIAFAVAKSLHASVGQLLQLPADATPGWGLVAVGTLKALQYGWLGIVLARLIEARANGRRFVLAGVIGGEVFGVPLFLVGVFAAPDPLPVAELLIHLFTEIAAPVACALVVYATESLSDRVSVRA